MLPRQGAQAEGRQGQGPPRLWVGARGRARAEGTRGCSQTGADEQRSVLSERLFWESLLLLQVLA